MKKIILTILGVILIMIVGGIGCLLVLGKLLQSPEGSTCVPNHPCASGFKCIGKICSSGKLNSYCESTTDCLTPYCVKNVCRADTKVSIFVDEEPLNPNNLKKIKVATIIVGLLDGNLTLDFATGTDINITLLKNALDEIKKRPTLTLTGENETIIDGQPVIAMQAWKVTKTDPDYAYAVVETLRMEFGLEAEKEK